MDYKEALATIQNADIETGNDIVKAIQNRVAELTKDSGKQSQRVQKLEALINLLGVEGDDLDSKLLAAETKVKALSNELNQSKATLSTLEAEKLQAENKVTQLERKSQIQIAASKVGAVSEVLAQLLLNIPSDKIAFIEQGVTIDEKPLKEYADSNPDWKPFIPALFPAQNQSQTRLPTGSTNGNTQKVDSVSTYLSSNYKIPSYLNGTN